MFNIVHRFWARLVLFAGPSPLSAPPIPDASSYLEDGKTFLEETIIVDKNV